MNKTINPKLFSLDNSITAILSRAEFSTQVTCLDPRHGLGCQCGREQKADKGIEAVGKERN